MVSICSKHHLTWMWQQCVHIHNQNMHYQVENVSCVVVHNVHVLIFQFQNNDIKIQIVVLQ